MPACWLLAPTTSPHQVAVEAEPVLVEAARRLDPPRLGQAVGRIQAFIGEAVLVGQPAFVDHLVVERQHAHHPVLLDLDHQVGA